MKELVKVLNQLGLNEATLQSLFERGEEKGYYLAAPGTTALELWQKLRDQLDQTGFWPVLLGDEEALEAIKTNQFSRAWSTNEILEKSSLLTFRQN